MVFIDHLLNISFIDPELAEDFVNSLRYLKITQKAAYQNKPLP